MGTIQSVDPPDGTPLGATFDEGRWQPVTIVVADATDPLLLWVRVGEGAFAWHVIFDGASFAPLYAQTSSVSVDGVLQTFTILPLGGWTAAPEIRVLEFQDLEVG